MTDPLFQQIASDVDARNGATFQQSAFLGVQQSPEEFISSQKLAKRAGVPVSIAKDPTLRGDLENKAKLNDLRRDLGYSPKIQEWMTKDPGNVSLAQGDSTLSKMEAVAQLPELSRLTPEQRDAVLQNYQAVAEHNAGTDEGSSAIASTLHAFAEPILNMAKAAAPYTIGGVLDKQVTNAVRGTGLFLDWISGRKTWDQINQESSDFNRFDGGALTKWQTKQADRFVEHQASLIKAGPALKMKAGGKTFTNPLGETVKGKWEHADWIRSEVVNPILNRNTVNALESMPGTLASFVAGGEVAPMMFAWNAAKSSMQQAEEEGANPYLAAGEGLVSGLLNTLLMTKVPHAVPTKTRIGAVGQAVGRGTVLGSGMAVGENLAARLHDPDRPLTEGLASQIATFIPFEVPTMVGIMSGIAQESKLRERHVEKFRECLGSALKDSKLERVEIPAEDFATFYQSKGKDPLEAFRSAPADVYEKLRSEFLGAHECGGDMRIPSADFLAYLPAEEQQGLLGDIRPEVGKPTANEAKRWIEAGGPEQMRASIEALAKETDPSPAYQAIRDSVYGQLVEAGRSPRVAEVESGLFAKMISNRAEREGMDPNVLLEPYGLKIIGPDDPLTKDVEGVMAAQFNQSAFHGSPYRFDKFSLEHMGKGEGAQAYGWGLYFAGNKEVAEYYKKVLQPPAEITNWKFGATNLIRNGEYRDYSPRDNTSLSQARASLSEDLLIREGDITRAFEEGGIEAAKSVMLEVADNLIKYAEQDNPDILHDLKFLRSQIENKLQFEAKHEKGQLYEADIPEDNTMLLWDKPLSEQPEVVKKALEGNTNRLWRIFTTLPGRNSEDAVGTGYGKTVDEAREDWASTNKFTGDLSRVRAEHYDDPTGEKFYHAISGDGGDEAASKMLHSLGISGIKYLDGSSRAEGEGSYNYVVFDDNAVKILKTFYQSGMDFGSKEWNEYYGLRHGSKPLDERAQRHREGMEQSLTKSGEQEELNRRTDEAKAEEAEFAKFDAEVKKIQAKDIHADPNEIRRGFIQFSGDRKVTIGFLQDANLSTFIHEMHHFGFEMIADLAEREGASEGIKQDFQTLLKFVGAKDRNLTSEQHETLARAGEAYFMEGKSPSPELRGVFTRIKFWMLQVYNNIMNLGVKLSPEVREVFDRMYASDAEIEQAKHDVGDRPLFATAEDMKATPEEFKAYVERSATERAHAQDLMDRQVMEETRRERENWWKEETKRVRQEVTAEVENDAVTKAFKALTSGQTEDGIPIKLNKEAIERQYGEGIAKELPRSFGRAYAVEGGMDADAAAELLGFRSGEALVETLRNMEKPKDRIERLTKERMQETHPGLTDPLAMAEAAQNAVHDADPEAKYAELKALYRAKRTLKPALDMAKGKEQSEAFWARGVLNEIPPMSAFREEAQKQIERMPAKDYDPNRYLRGQKKASMDAFKALGEKDYGAAASAKQKEILNHFLYREAVKAKRESEEFYDYGRKLMKSKTRDKLMPTERDEAGQAFKDTRFLDAIDALLEQCEFTRTSKKELDNRQFGYDLAIQMAGEGEMLAFDPALFLDRPKNYREMTLPETRAMSDALHNLETMARRQHGFSVAGEHVAFEKATGEMVAAALGHLEAKPQPLDANAKGRIDKAVSTAKRVNVEFLKFEEIVDRLDNGDINGPFRRYVFNPMCESQFMEWDLNQRTLGLLNEAMEAMPKEQRLSLGDKYECGVFGPVTRKWILSLAFNLGNDSNQNKLIKGLMQEPSMRGKTLEEITDGVSVAISKLNKADWEFVQKTGDALASLWPEIEALQLRMTGVAPERVEVRSFQVQTKEGPIDLKGWYYPICYDSAKSDAGARQADVDIMGEKGWNSPQTFQGHTKSRVEKFSKPLLLDFEQVLSKHTSRVIKDTSHRENALSVAKLLKNQAVRDAVQQTLGPEYEAMMLPWLKGTVNDTAVLNPEIGKFMLGLRTNMVIAGLAFRASSVAVQITDMGRVMVGEHAVHPKFVTSAAADMARHPLETVAMVRSLSKEMVARADNLDRDTRALMKRNLGKDGMYVKAQNFGMMGLAIADAITSHTAWLGAYRQALSKNVSQPDAVRMADRVVRMKLYGGAAKDLTKLQRDGSWGTKLVTTYMGDAISTYGMMSRAYFNLSHGEKVASSVFAALVAGMVLPLIGDLIKGQRPKDDEDWGWWLGKQAAWNLPSSIPLARDIANSIASDRDYQFSPVIGAINKGKAFTKTTIKMASGESDLEWGDYFTRGLSAVGPFTGLPGTSQTTTTLRYLNDVSEGNEEFNVYNAVMGKPK